MRSFNYMGKYNGDENSLPQRDHPRGSVKFKEPEDMKKLALRVNLAAILMFPVLYMIACLRAGGFVYSIWGCIAAIISMVPHEFLHGICMPGDVYMYQNLKQGLLFVVSPDDMTGPRFVFMSLLPNIVFGFIPFIIFMIFPKMMFFGMLGVISIPAGAGDYLNVFNAVTQMPKGALTYLSGMHSYWYIPDKN